MTCWGIALTEHTNSRLLSEARETLDEATWAYLMGGSGTEATLRRNRLALERLAVVPQVLTDVRRLDPATEFLGVELRIPVAMAPVGSLEVFHPEGAGAVADAAGDFGVLQVVGSVGSDIESLAERTSGHLAYQVFPWGEDKDPRSLVEPAENAQVTAVVLTVDVAWKARRERQDLSGFHVPGKTAPDRAALRGATWAHVEELCRITDLPVILKGVQSADDARIAAESGVDAVWVSNHGGRQIDHGRGAVDTLGSVVAEVGGTTPIVVDGGFMTGTDVVKALAIGADLVAVGKLQCLALACGGAPSVLSMLEILEDEITSQMGLLGARTVGDLTPENVVDSITSHLPDPLDPWSALS